MGRRVGRTFWLGGRRVGRDSVDFGRASTAVFYRRMARVSGCYT